MHLNILTWGTKFPTNICGNEKADQKHELLNDWHLIHVYLLPTTFKISFKISSKVICIVRADRDPFNRKCRLPWHGSRTFMNNFKSTSTTIVRCHTWIQSEIASKTLTWMNTVVDKSQCAAITQDMPHCQNPLKKSYF